MPLMYLESMVDGAMKGTGSRKPLSGTAYGTPCCVTGGVALLLPRYGMRGFLGGDPVFQLLHLHGQHRAAAAFQRHRARLPALAGRTAAGCCCRRGGRAGVRRALAGFPAQGLAGQLAVLTAGGMVTAIVFLLAALPLGLWEESRAVLRQAKTGKTGERLGGIGSSGT